MADDLIHCPSCGFQLRLPAELYGSPVECPQCHVRFTAPVPAAHPAGPRPPTASEYDVVARPAYDGGPNPLTAPAVALLITSLLGAAGWAYFALGLIELKNNPAQLDQIVQDAINKNPQIRPEDRAEVKRIFDQMIEVGPPWSFGIGAVNLATALGAVFMLIRRGYVLALLGTVLALNPINVPCCLLQVPFGIWGLIALLSESGRRAFR
jgi:hypothetical protein